MLYNKYLDTFLKVADAGSFNRAAAELFITPSAVIKQIRALEEDLGVPLFRRSHRGLTLTASGESLYDDARLLIDSACRAADRARAQGDSGDNVLRIGVSPTTPADVLTDLYPLIYENWPELKFQMIPFENTPKNASEILGNLGQGIDLVGGVFDETLLRYRKCRGFELYQEPLKLAVPVSHPLAARGKITMPELDGETLLLLSPGKMKNMDLLRTYLGKYHPKVAIQDFDLYQTAVFNESESTGKLLVSTDVWQRAHPLLRTIPVEWPFSIPYGLLYSLSPSPKVRKLLRILRLSRQQ